MTGLLERPTRLRLGRGMALRLLSALEVLEARREAGALARDGRELALCANACLLSRALVGPWGAVYSSGDEVLARLTAGEIEALAAKWSAFNREANPSPEDGEERVNELKKAWSTRLGSAFAGVCSVLLGRSPRRREPEG